MEASPPESVRSKTPPPEFSESVRSRTPPPEFSESVRSRTPPPEFSESVRSRTPPPEFSESVRSRTPPPEFSESVRSRTPPPEFSVEPAAAKDSDFSSALSLHRACLKMHCDHVTEGFEGAGERTSLSRIYTELYITQTYRMEQRPQHELQRLEAGFQKVQEEMPIPCKDIFRTQSHDPGPIRAVLTLGVAGVGKTFSVLKFCVDWAQGSENQDLDLVLPLSFRELNLTRGRRHSLLELIEMFHPSLCPLSAHSLLVRKVLLILDGLDESRLLLDFSCEQLSDPSVRAEESNQRLLRVLLGPVQTDSQSILKTIQNLRDMNTGNISAHASITVFCCLSEMKDHSVHQQILDLLKSELESEPSEFHCTTLAEKLQMPQEVLQELHIKRFKELPDGRLKLVPPDTCREATILWSGLSKEHAAVVAAALSSSQLQHLDVWLRDSDAVEAFSEGLRDHHCRLQTLSLHHSRLSESSCSCLVSALDSNPSHLRKLDLSWNEDLQDPGLKTLCSFLQRVRGHSVTRRSSGQRSQCHLEVLRSEVTVSPGGPQVGSEVTVSPGGPQVRGHSVTWRSSGQRSQCHLEVLRSEVRGYSVTWRSSGQRSQCHLEVLRSEVRGYSVTWRSSGRVRGHSVTRRSSGQRSQCHLEVLRSEVTVSPGGPQVRGQRLQCHLEVLRSEVTVSPGGLQVRGHSVTWRSSGQRLQCHLEVLRSEVTVSPGGPQIRVHSVTWRSSGQRSQCHLEVFRSEVKVSLGGPQIPCDSLLPPVSRLENCGLGEGSCRSLSSALMVNPHHLRELDVTQNQLGDGGVEALCEALQMPQLRLEHLRLDNCGLSVLSCSCLASALSSNPESNLKKLDLSVNAVKDHGVELLCGYLRSPQCHLEAIELKGCGLTETSGALLSSALNPHIKDLRLNWNPELKDAGAEHMSGFLRREGCGLEVLSLRWSGTPRTADLA
uniref:NACHT domain-containing protein n=1 Tax=Knipowitschia caucasica TaxID=637954 RepID=A0AAV2LTU1_KNICA